jgi:cytochrome b
MTLCSPLRNNLLWRRFFRCAHQLGGSFYHCEELGESYTRLGYCWGVVLLLSNLIYRKNTTTKHAAAALTMAQPDLTMASWFWRTFLPTHANCHASTDRIGRILLVDMREWGTIAADVVTTRRRTLRGSCELCHR